MAIPIRSSSSGSSSGTCDLSEHASSKRNGSRPERKNPTECAADELSTRLTLLLFSQRVNWSRVYARSFRSTRVLCSSSSVFSPSPFGRMMTSGNAGGQEMLDIGKHCTLASCRRLDFTPHLCAHCAAYFCGAHRLDHGCPASDADVAREKLDVAPLRPFACSLPGCAAAESVRVECESCSKIFCLKHRHVADHGCAKVDNNRLTGDASTSNRRAVESNATEPVPYVVTKKQLTAAEALRVDRVLAMRARSRNTDKIPSGEAIVLFAFDQKGDKQAAVVSKAWTVGRALDKLRRSVASLEKASSMCVPDATSPLDAAETVGRFFQDLSLVQLHFTSE